MAITRRGFTLANGPDDQFGSSLDSISVGMNDQPPTDTESLVALINRLLANYGQQQVPPGLTGASLINELDRIVSGIESTVVTPMAKAAMANRRRPTARIPTDAEIELRLKAKGIDPKFMPRSGR